MKLFFLCLISILIVCSSTNPCILSPPAANAYDYDIGTQPSTCTPTTRCGPSAWHNIASSYLKGKSNNCAGPSSTIAVLQGQSPIDFNNEGSLIDPEIEFPKDISEDDGCDAWVSFANDHYWEVSFEEAHCSNLKVLHDGEEYTLLQTHLHSPSEHTIGGGRFDAEMHMVHASAAGKLLVIGVLLDSTLADVDGENNNKLLNSFWKEAKTLAGLDPAVTNLTQDPQAVKCQWDVETSDPINPYSMILPGTGDFFTYTGGLTTPPCTGGVTFFIPVTPVKISQADLNNIRVSVATYTNGTDTSMVSSTASNFARPTQPLAGRVVRIGTLQAQATPAPTEMSEDKKRMEERVNQATVISGVALALGCFSLILTLILNFCSSKSSKISS